MIGNSTGTNKTDFDWLYTFESESFYYRLVSVELCKVSGVLVGVRASVVKIIVSSKKSSLATQLTRFGNVNQTSSVTCQSLSLNYAKDEFISNATISYSDQIDVISLFTNLGQNLTVGVPISTSKNQSLVFEQKNMPLAFQGSFVLNKEISSLGFITV